MSFLSFDFEVALCTYITISLFLYFTTRDLEFIRLLAAAFQQVIVLFCSLFLSFLYDLHLPSSLLQLRRGELKRTGGLVLFLIRCLYV